MNFIAIDIGTSFFKGAVVDVEKMTLQHVTRSAAPEPISNSNPLYHELNPQEVVEDVRALILDLSSRADCSGVLMCGQMGGLVLVDQQGDALSPYLSWLDRRTLSPHPSEAGSYFDVFASRVGETAARRLGNEFRPGLPLPFLFWMKEQGRLPAGCIPLTLPDFVAANLTGGKPVMEWTSATGSLDVETRQVPEDLLAMAGLDEIRWPQLVDFRHVVGEIKTNEKSLPVYAAVGDHQCSLAGTLLSKGELSLNISTGSQVAAISETAEAGDYQLRPFFDETWLKTLTNIPAGRALNAIVGLLTELGPAGSSSENAWEKFLEQAESIDSSDIEINLAMFPSPVQGPGFMGNLREDNMTVAHISRASLEAMAIYYDEFASRLFPNRDWNRLVFSGGVVQKSNLLRTLILTRLGNAHRLTSSTEDALLGLGILGRVVGGLNQTVSMACEEIAKRE
jgi:sugar (pentulose or hexulose) kinase